MINPTSLAAAVGVGVKNTQFQSEASNLPRKILVAATYDPAKTAVVPLVPVQVLSPEDTGDRFGFGSMAHRLVLQAFLGGAGVPVFVLPQAEAGAAVVAAGSVDFTTSTGVASGTIYLYVAGIAVPVTIPAAATPTAIALLLVAAITANKLLPVTAAVDGVAPGKVNVTAKSKGPWGNRISLTVNIGLNQTLPVGVVCTVTSMTAGAGIPVMATALAALGTGDDANEGGFTDFVHGYGQDTTTLDALSAYVGAGNDFTGLYSKTIGRPFRSLSGDVATGSAGLAALIVISDARKLDRTNGIVSVPGSASHPAEIAAQTIGHMARINQERVAQHYLGVSLIDIHTGAKVDRWNSDYDNRDTAVKSGISPVRIQNGVVVLQNVVSFYRPDNVPVASNGYRSMRNIAIIQNLLANIRQNFEQEKWQGISIVANVTNVTNTNDRMKCRDIDAVRNDLILLANSFAGHGWLYEAAFTIRKLNEAGAITIRPGGLGFDNVLSVIFSGEGNILNTEVQFDTSLAVLLN